MKIIKIAFQGAAFIAAAVAVATPSSAASSCNDITARLDTVTPITCGASASGRFASSTRNKNILVDLIKGSQLDAIGVTPTGKLLSTTCSVRDRTTTGSVPTPVGSCIPKPGESWSGVRAILYK